MLSSVTEHRGPAALSKWWPAEVDTRGTNVNRPERPAIREALGTRVNHSRFQAVLQDSLRPMCSHESRSAEAIGKEDGDRNSQVRPHHIMIRAWLIAAGVLLVMRYLQLTEVVGRYVDLNALAV